jgi:hypothetical protein
LLLTFEFLLFHTDTSVPCRHDIRHTLIEEPIKTYFTTAYYEEHTNMCSKCALCNLGFGTDIKVSNDNPVYLCVNAKKPTHACTFGKCRKCYDEWVVKQKRCTRSSLPK